MAKPRIFRNKRAEIPDFVSDIFSFFLYLTGFLAFTILFMMSFGGCDELESQSQNIMAEFSTGVAEEQFLLNYLRTNLSIDGRQTNYAELISESCTSNTFGLIKEKTKEMMKVGVESVAQVKLSVKCGQEDNGIVELYRITPPESCPYQYICDYTHEIKFNIPIGYYGTGYDVDNFNYATVIQTICVFSDDVSYDALIAGGCIR